MSLPDGFLNAGGDHAARSARLAPAARLCRLRLHAREPTGFRAPAVSRRLFTRAGWQLFFTPSRIIPLDSRQRPSSSHLEKTLWGNTRGRHRESIDSARPEILDSVSGATCHECALPCVFTNEGLRGSGRGSARRVTGRQGWESRPALGRRLWVASLTALGARKGSACPQQAGISLPCLPTSVPSQKQGCHSGGQPGL
jgi:hypothetical protein